LREFSGNLRQKEPVIDLRMLKERNFAVATGAMFFLGFVLYSSTVLIPQFLQQLLGYTAQLSGNGAVAGRSGDHVHDAHCRNPGVKSGPADSGHVWVHRVGVGACCDGGLGTSGWITGTRCGRACCNLRTGVLLFIPINVAAFAYVPKEKKHMGTGIINLARNMGAKRGICDGDDDAGAARAISSIEADGARQPISSRRITNMLNGTQAS